MAEQSVFKARSAIEEFENRHGFIKFKDLKKQNETLLNGYKTQIKLIDLFPDIKEPTEFDEIPESNYETQKNIRTLRWIWILKRKYKEFEVKKLLEAIKKSGMELEEFAEYIAASYYYLSSSIHKSLHTKGLGNVMIHALTGIPEASEAVSVFLSIFDFRKPF